MCGYGGVASLGWGALNVAGVIWKPESCSSILAITRRARRCVAPAHGRRMPTSSLVICFAINFTLLTSGKNMWSDHTIRCDHTISKKWTFVHTEISFHHTIKIWSHRKKFVHTINFLDHTVIILFTPSVDHTLKKICSHHLNFDHTIYFQDHTVMILFTPSRFYSHSCWNFVSHHLNFVHTLSIVFTLKNRVVHTQHIFNVCDQARLLTTQLR